MPDIKLTKDVLGELSERVLAGMKVPHSLSHPLVRPEEDRLVLASFAFTYTADDLKSGLVGRPRYWAIADAITGDFIAAYDCKVEDFSQQPFDAKYSIEFDAGDKAGPDYMERAFALLDEVRRGYAYSRALDVDAYRRYFEMILASIPPEFHVFYEELGSPELLARR